MLSLFQKNIQYLNRLNRIALRFVTGSGFDPRRGAGSGGGSGGSIRDAGGAFAELQAVREEEFFITQQNELLKKLKGRRITLDDYHLERIKAIKKYTKILEKRKRFSNENDN